jgi:hypothetical protein
VAKRCADSGGVENGGRREEGEGIPQVIYICALPVPTDIQKVWDFFEEILPILPHIDSIVLRWKGALPHPSPESSPGPIGAIDGWYLCMAKSVRY